MKLAFTTKLFTLALLSGLFFLSCHAESSRSKCEIDSDCKNGRVCINKTCRVPNQTDVQDSQIPDVTEDLIETQEDDISQETQDNEISEETNCTPDCFGRECGPDPICGESCGPTCSEGEYCLEGSCEFGDCIPECMDQECGLDPVCGEVCGNCPPDSQCIDGFCEEEPCIPECMNQECGPDPICNESCGNCPNGFSCDDGECIEEQCIPNCSGLECGPDPMCDESCGNCQNGFNCDDGECIEEQCIPNCSGLECGPDPMCDESCGNCPDGFNCDDGECIEEQCTPNCSGLECGPDPICDESCGRCANGLSCNDGECVSCTSDNDCDENETCEDGNCIGETGCQTADDCEPGESCVNRNCIPCEQDQYEPNSNESESAEIELDFPAEDLTLCGDRDSDWFQLELEERTEYRIDIYFFHSEGDIDMRLQNQYYQDLEVSSSTSNEEHIIYVVPANQAGTYYLRVYLYSGSIHSYSLEINSIPNLECENGCDSGEQCINGECVIPDCDTYRDCESGSVCIDDLCTEFTCSINNHCPENLTCNIDGCVECIGWYDCEDDMDCVENICVALCYGDDYFPNQDQENATELAIPYFTESLTLCSAEDEDWYQFELNEEWTYTINLEFEHALGNIDGIVTIPSGEMIAQGNSNTDNELFEVTATQSGTHYLIVQIHRNDSEEPTYYFNITAGSVCEFDSDCGADETCLDERCFREPECGNAIQEEDELCDDGNENDNDGCTAECEITADEEPNDNHEEAIAVSDIPQTFYGKIDPSEDLDWYRMELTTGDYIFETFDSSNEVDPVDTLIYLCQDLNPEICSLDNQDILGDDDSGEGLYSQLTATLEENTYYLIIQSYNNSSTGFYGLTISR